MKRTIDEILALYELEPNTRKDVFVEGANDKDFVNWYLEESKLGGRSAYSIDTIDVPNDLVAAFQLGLGSNRNRVIALAFAVWAELTQDCELNFVVDRDLSQFIPEHRPPPGILSTDFPSMEGYLMSYNTLDKFFSSVCRVCALDRRAIIHSLFSFISFAFAFRVALGRLQINVATLDVSRFLSMAGGAFSYEGSELIRRSLSASNQLARLRETEQAIRVSTEEIAQAGLTPQDVCHGHDSLALVGECAHLLDRKSAYRVEGTTRSALRLTIDVAYLDSFPLFQAIRA